MSQQLEFLLNAFWPRAEALHILATQYTADFNLSGEGSEVVEVRAEVIQISSDASKSELLFGLMQLQG